jgi:hypothetical protein
VNLGILFAGAEICNMETNSPGRTQQLAVQCNQQSHIDHHSERETGQEKRRPLWKKSKPHDNLVSSLSQPETAPFAEDVCLDIDFLDQQENRPYNNDGQAHVSHCPPAGTKDDLPHDGSLQLVGTQADNDCSDLNAPVLRKPQLGASRRRFCGSREAPPSFCFAGPSGQVVASGTESPVQDSPHKQSSWNHNGRLPGTVRAKPIIERKTTRNAETKASKVPTLHLVKAGDAGTRDTEASSIESRSNAAQVNMLQH